MTRSIPWDDLPSVIDGSSRQIKSSKESDKSDLKIPVEEIAAERDYYKEAVEVGRRALFGIVCGSITGATFGFVEVTRDSKAMIAKKSVTTAKVLRFTGLFAGFFGSYHGIRKLLRYNVKQTSEENVFLAATLCLAPLVVRPSLRPLFPYGVMLIGLDAINGIDDI